MPKLHEDGKDEYVHGGVECETSDIEIFKLALIVACTTTTCIVNLYV